MERGREGGRQGYIYIERESGRGCWRAPENLAALCHESSFGDMRGVDDTTGILTIDKNNISTTMKKGEEGRQARRGEAHVDGARDEHGHSCNTEWYSRRAWLSRAKCWQPNMIVEFIWWCLHVCM